MKTIEERAKEYGSKKGDISLSPVYNEALARIYEEAYIAGAKEQNRIDIDVACKWVKTRKILTDVNLEEFRKVIKN